MYLPEFTSFLSTTKWLRNNYQRNCGVGIPKYFTPNNDSYNDGWELRMTKYPDATINIFDMANKLQP
jgi:hypothetical protein